MLTGYHILSLLQFRVCEFVWIQGNYGYGYYRPSEIYCLNVHLVIEFLAIIGRYMVGT